MFRRILAVFTLHLAVLSFSALAEDSGVYDVAEGDLFEARLSGPMVLKSTVYGDECGEAVTREDGSFERMIKDGKIMLLRRGDQLRVTSSGTREVPCNVIRNGKEIGRWFCATLFDKDCFKRLNRLSQERARAEQERNAPSPSQGILAPPAPFQLSPAAAKRHANRSDKMR